jgi:hypothetical protein
MSETTNAGTSTDSPTGRRRVWMAVLVVGGLFLAYHLFVRPWRLDWGATDDEVDRRLASRR